MVSNLDISGRVAVNVCFMLCQDWEDPWVLDRRMGPQVGDRGGETPEIKPIIYSSAFIRQASKIRFPGSKARLFLFTPD